MADEPNDHDKGEGNEPAKSLEDFVTEHYNKQKVESLFTHTFPTFFWHRYSISNKKRQNNIQEQCFNLMFILKAWPSKCSNTDIQIMHFICIYTFYTSIFLCSAELYTQEHKTHS